MESSLSISNEKPPQLPRDMPEANISIYEIFQSQTRSRPSCHASALAALLAGRDFQSQTRSRPSCHACLAPASRSSRSLSISNEKPPQLPPAMMVRRRCCQMPTFNLKREAAPVATFERLRENCIGHPLSISNEKPPQLPLPRTLRVVNVLPLSISNEKPPQLPRHASSECGLCFFLSISNEKPPQLPRIARL